MAYAVICGRLIFICVGMRSCLISQMKLLFYGKIKRLINRSYGSDFIAAPFWQR